MYTPIKGMLLAAAGASLFSFLQAQTPAKEAVRFDTRLSHTAIWVGDPFEYRITLTHPKDVVIIRDNLKTENLNLDPFVILDLGFDERPSGSDAATLDIILQLTIKDAGAGEGVIPPLNLYYATRSRGALGKGTDLETHTLVIPEKKVGLRSTLTTDSRDIRDAARLEGPGGLATKIWIPAWALLGLALFLTGQWVLAERRLRARSVHKRDRKAIEQQALNTLRAISASANGSESPESYHQVSQVLQNALKELLEVEAVALTPEELQQELERKNVRESLSKQLGSILESCDAARYARRDRGGAAGGLQSLIQESQKAIAQLVQL